MAAPAQSLSSASFSSPLRYRVQIGAGLAFAAFILVLPFIGVTPFLLSFATEVLIFSIFAMSLDLLLGYTGLVSLCHAAFFGIGAYAAGLTALRFSPEIGVILAVSIFMTVALAGIIGSLSIRLSGFLFLMVTIAFSQMVYAAAYRWNWLTGGSDGITVPPSIFFGKPIFSSKAIIYYVTLGTFALTWFALRRIVNSPFGQALVGIRENTSRMRAIGFNVRRHKLLAFIVAAFFAGLAGILNVQYNLYVSPQDTHLALSVSVMVMVLIGGAGTLVGPVIGAAVYLILQNWLSSYTEYWNFFIGAIFIALITGAPQGLQGLARQGWNWLWRQKR
jgi:branched-chain amino acid transport system permease protein